MALSLINLLNKHDGKTPDEIVSEIKLRGWIYLGDISSSDQEYLFNHDCVLVALHDYDARRWQIVQGDRRGWNFWFDIDYCHDSWQGAWACRLEEYKNGSLPDPTPEQVRP